MRHADMRMQETKTGFRFLRLDEKTGRACLFYCGRLLGFRSGCRCCSSFLCFFLRCFVLFSVGLCFGFGFCSRSSVSGSSRLLCECDGGKQADNQGSDQFFHVNALS